MNNTSYNEPLKVVLNCNRYRLNMLLTFYIANCNLRRSKSKEASVMIIGFFKLSILLFIVSLILLPLWLYFNYKSKKQYNEPLSEDDRIAINGLTKEIKHLNQRIQQLESELDYRDPNWWKEDSK